MRQRSLKRAALGTSLWVAVGAWSVWLSGGVSAAETQEPDPPRKKPDCVFVPTPHDIVEHMLDMAHVQKGDVVYDLGCGDGRIVIQAARKRGCRGVGFEIDPELAARARAEAKRQGVEHLVALPRLARLRLSHCEQLTDLGVSHLARIRTLVDLDLSWCAGVTDAGLDDLHTMPALTRVNLQLCYGITAAGRAALDDALRGCAVEV